MRKRGVRMEVRRKGRRKRRGCRQSSCWSLDENCLYPKRQSALSIGSTSIIWLNVVLLPRIDLSEVDSNSRKSGVFW